MDLPVWQALQLETCRSRCRGHRRSAWRSGAPGSPAVHRGRPIPSIRRWSTEPSASDDFFVWPTSRAGSGSTKRGSSSRPMRAVGRPRSMRPEARTADPTLGRRRRFGFDAAPMPTWSRDSVREWLRQPVALSLEEVVARSHPSDRRGFGGGGAGWPSTCGARRVQRPGSVSLFPGPHVPARQHHLQATGVFAVSDGRHDEPNNHTRIMRSPTASEEWPFVSDFPPTWPLRPARDHRLA